MAANTNAETPLGSLPEDPKIAAGPAAPNASEAVDAARKHEEAAKAAKEAQDAEERARLKALGQAAAPTRGGIQRAFEWIIGGWVFTVDVVPANIQVPCAVRDVWIVDATFTTVASSPGMWRNIFTGLSPSFWDTGADRITQAGRLARPLPLGSVTTARGEDFKEPYGTTARLPNVIWTRERIVAHIIGLSLNGQLPLLMIGPCTRALATHAIDANGNITGRIAPFPMAIPTADDFRWVANWLGGAVKAIGTSQVSCATTAELKGLTHAGVKLTPFLRRLSLQQNVVYSRVELCTAFTHELEETAQAQFAKYVKVIAAQWEEMHGIAQGGDFSGILPRGARFAYDVDPDVGFRGWDNARRNLWQTIALTRAMPTLESNSLQLAMPLLALDWLYERPEWAAEYAGWRAGWFGATWMTDTEIMIIALLLDWPRNQQDWDPALPVWFTVPENVPNGLNERTTTALRTFLNQGVEAAVALSNMYHDHDPPLDPLEGERWRHGYNASPWANRDMADVYWACMQRHDEFGTYVINIRGRKPILEVTSRPEGSGCAYIPLAIAPLNLYQWTAYVYSWYVPDSKAEDASAKPCRIDPPTENDQQSQTQWLYLASYVNQVLDNPSTRFGAQFTWIGGPYPDIWTAEPRIKHAQIQLAAEVLHGEGWEAFLFCLRPEDLAITQAPPRANYGPRAGGPYAAPADLINGVKFIGDAPYDMAGDENDFNETAPMWWAPAICKARLPISYRSLILGMVTGNVFEPYIEAEMPKRPASAEKLLMYGRNEFQTTLTKAKNQWGFLTFLLKLRKQARLEWETDRLQRATSGDWQAYRQLKKAGNEGWDVTFAEAHEGREPHRVIHDHLASIYTTGQVIPPKGAWEGQVELFTMEELEMALARGKKGKAVRVDLTSHELLMGIAGVPEGKEALLRFYNRVYVDAIGDGATFRSWHALLAETDAVLQTGWDNSRLQLDRGIKQGSIESPALFSYLAEQILEETKAEFSWADRPRAFEGLGLEEVLFMDDGCVWAPSAAALGRKLEEWSQVLLRAGLSLNPSKCKIYFSPHADRTKDVQVFGRVIPALSHFTITGVPFRVGACASELLAPFFQRAKDKFWALKHLLRARTPLKGRVLLLDRVVGGMVLWCLAALTPDAGGMQLLNSLQLQLVALVDDVVGALVVLCRVRVGAEGRVMVALQLECTHSALAEDLVQTLRISAMWHLRVLWAWVASLAVPTLAAFPKGDVAAFHEAKHVKRPGTSSPTTDDERTDPPTFDLTPLRG
ncbi:unnamed protein product, partial [Symbiodinium microadriaticum]